MTAKKRADGKIAVMNKMCDQCLFGPNKIVSEARKREVLAHCRSRDAHFVCHKFTLAGEEGVCHEFFQQETTNLLRVMERFNGIEFVSPDDYEKGHRAKKKCKTKKEEAKT